MIIHANANPFPHLIVDSVYDQNQLNLIWRETEFLYDKLGGPEATNAAAREDGFTRKKSGSGLFLDTFYKENSHSDIFNITRFPYLSEQIGNAVSSLGLYFKLYNKANWDSTLVQYYGDGDYYEPHNDESLFSLIYTYYKTPKQFEGGDLEFEEYDYYVPCENNQLIIFPSCINHAVSTVKYQENKDMYGRFSIANLLFWNFNNVR